MIKVALGSEKLKCLPFFHAFTGCDKVSFSAGKGKEENHFGDPRSFFFSCYFHDVITPEIRRQNQLFSINRKIFFTTSRLQQHNIN